MALIFLSGDTELNPGFQTLKDIKSTRGLKIAHLNIRSLRNKTDALRLERIHNKTIDILTLSETWLIVKSLNQTICTGVYKLEHPPYN